MKSFLGIFSFFLLIIFIESNAQRVIISDLSYILDEEVEEKILTSSSEGQYIIEILTPRRYINESTLYSEINFSDLILYYTLNGSNDWTFDIFVVNEDLESVDFNSNIKEIQQKAIEEYFLFNRKSEGFRYVVDEIIKSLNKCAIQLTMQEDSFTPGIDNDRLEVTVNSECEKYEHIKFEVFSKLHSTAVYTLVTTKSSLTGNKINWDGKIPDQQNQFIRAADAPLSVKVSLSLDDSFNSSAVARTEIHIDESVDEWNRHKAFFDGYVVKNDYTGTNYEFYRDKLKDALIRTIPRQHLAEGIGPLDYLKENLIQIEFLGATFVTHKKFAEKLRGVEDELKAHENYEILRSTYQKLINGSFALRKIANRDDMSPHSLAGAIDIDPERNPHIKDEWGRQIFHVIQYVTNINMYLNKPTIEEMKYANQLFKTTFDNTFESKVVLQSEITQDRFIEANNMIRRHGEFDNVLQHLYEEIKEAVKLFNSFERGITNEDKQQAEFFRDKILGLRIQLGIHEQNMRDYFQQQPSYDFIREIDEKFSSDKKLLLEKVSLIRQYTSSSQDLHSLNATHEQNDFAQDLSTMIQPDKVENLKVLKNYIANQKAFLISIASKGFFELDKFIVQAFLDNVKIRWGGNYQNQKDFMHFELYPLSQNLN